MRAEGPLATSELALNRGAECQVFRALKMSIGAGELSIFIGKLAMVPVKVSMQGAQGEPPVEDQA